MRRLYKLFALIAFLLFALKNFAQGNPYPFEVKQTGKGAMAIVFIPGFACAGDVWNETRGPLENKYTCYTLTMAGFAGVPAQGEPTFAAREQAIAQFIKDKKLGKVIVIGHSMGGGWAMALAADYPELIEKIVIVDALPCLPAVFRPDFKVKETKDCSMMAPILSMKDEDFFQVQRKSMRQMVADTTKLDLVAGWAVKSDRKTFADLFCDFMNTDLRDKIATVQCPAMVLLEPSFAGIKAAVEAQYGKMKTADLRYANKGLHFIMYDDKEWFAQQLSSFIL